ncbi:tape measure protein [Acinetobacter radioresistens]|uniref:tape measure protein n=1 Tax=Acinetobacter radioresistens TaxID=40216 RepID=UPI002004FF49|nr:tape measure protein [Acinetobacter radioresistens]MCK4099731.1 tape measure protein [Acinetobacter radioresistens]
MAQESHLRVVIDSRQALRDARAISTELQSIEKNGDYAAKSMNGASTAVREFAGYMAGIVTVGAAISKMDAYTGINNQLKLVTNSQVQLTGAMNETFAIAQRSRSSWESVTQVYQKLAMNAEAAGIAQKDIGRLTETISKGIALSGSSSEQAAAAIMQLGQSLGAGKLSGDEFNSVMENGYGVMQLLAKGMDVPIGQLKKLAGEGKLTSEVVTQALLKMSSTADAEFAKTDATIGQSLGMLSNAVTQFVGEAGKGSGAANLLSGSIQALAGNLDLIADTAVVGGVAYLTKTIVGQTIATQGAISASMQRRAANLAELETQIQLSGLEVQRTRQVAGLALTELHLARQELNNATTRQARAAATMRLTQAEVALALAEKQRTAATIADTAAQNANNAARSRGAMLLGLVGGPVGALTLGVAALAAIYMLATDNGEEANKMLEEQSKFAGMATTELEKLEGVQRRAANESLALTFETQTNQLKGLKQEFIEATEQILDHNKKNLEVQRIYNELRAGVLGVEEAFSRLNKIETIGKDDIANVANYRDKYRELNNTLAETKPKLEATAKGIDSAKLKAQQGAEAVFKLNAELEKLFNQGKGNIVEATVTKRLADLNYDDRLISIINKYVAVEGSINTATGKFYDEVKKRITEEYRAVLAQDKALDGRNEREKERLAILEQQGKVLRINSKVQALDKKYNISAREAAAGLPSGLVKSVIMQESGGDTYRNGKLLTSPAGAQGLGQFMPATAKQYKVNVTNEASSISGVIAYLSDLFKRFGGDVEKTIMAYNAGPGNVDSGKAYGFKETRNYRNKIKGYMAGQSGLSFDAEFTVNDFDKILDDRTRLLAEQAETRKRIEYEAADEIGKIRQSLADRIQEIEAADFSSDKTKEYSRQAKIQAENEIKIIQAQQQDKLDAFNDYNKSEEALVKQHYARMQRDLALDLTLTEQQRKQATESIRKQEMHEIALIELAKQERLFQAEQAYSHEIYRIQESGRIEREQIRLTTKDAAEASRLIEASFKKQKQAANDALKSISEEWRSIQSRFSGMGEVGYINQEFKGYNETADKYRDAQRSAAEEDAARKREQLWRDEEVNRTISAEEAAQRRIEIEQNVATRLQEIDLEHFQNRIELEKQYYLARAELGLTYGEEIAGNWADVFKQMYGEQSSAYAAMFALEKGFAVAKALMAAPEAYSKAYNAVVGIPYVGPYIAPVMGGAAAAAQVAQAAIIKGVNFTGYETGGYTGNYGKSEVAGVVHGQEYVLNAEATRRVGINTLNAINSGADIQAERQAQANVKAMPQQSQPQVIDNNLRVIMVKDENEAKDWLYSSDGEKAFLYHMKRNRSKI